MKSDDELDAVGLLCPLPVLKARKRLQGLKSQQILLMRADDPAAQLDVPHFCNESGHELVQVENHGSEKHFYIRKK